MAWPPCGKLAALCCVTQADGDRLMATLGSRSTTKKVSRKAILDVDVPKACDTVIEPGAPMALRLQGNLLCVVPSIAVRIPR
jgi:hypothetical protein